MISDFLIQGDTFTDTRGTLRFANAFDMSEVVRFYEILPKDEDLIRAWQGHQFEKKWFHCLSGSFVINIVEVDDFENPSESLTPIRFELNAVKPNILAVPGGYATGIKANAPGSRLQVFSNFGLSESSADDYRYTLEKWVAQW